MNTKRAYDLLFPLMKPALYAMDPEKAHKLTIMALKTGLAPAIDAACPSSLNVVLWNRVFPNPIGLAAGFDKNAEVIPAMFRFGLGFVEVGTVTPKPQDGNPKPRIFRSPSHEAIINRMGFPNEGLDSFRKNIEKFLETKPRPLGLVGINIGMNKAQTDPIKDYTLLVQKLGPYADYLAVNISSPNTPGLRTLQAREHLLPLLEAILAERGRACRTNPPPLLVKFAPDLDEKQQEEAAQTVLEAGVDGLIISNTTLERPATLPADFRAQAGGLSGLPLKEKSTQAIARFYALTGGRLPIIGVGGISSAEDVYEKIKAGASLVQIYSALVFHGPQLVADILEKLPALLKKDGHSHIMQARGTKVSL